MVSIIAVNHNRKSYLKNCLDSVTNQSFEDLEIIVIDNASSDGSAEMIKNNHKNIKLIENKQNLLFCKAYNQGIEASEGEFVLCLNNDVILGKDYLEEAFSAVSLDEKIGMISGKILRMDGETIDSTGLFLGRNRKAVERGYGKIDKGQYEKAGYVFGVSGACAFFRRSMLMAVKDEHGYFDERFGMYYEDLDLCWRAQKKGWKAYYNPKAIAYHLRGGTSISNREERPLNLRYLLNELKKKYIKNRYKCIVKNDTLWGVLINLPFIMLYEIKIWSYVFLRLLRSFHR